MTVMRRVATVAASLLILAVHEVLFRHDPDRRYP